MNQGFPGRVIVFRLSGYTYGPLISLGQFGLRKLLPAMVRQRFSAAAIVFYIAFSSAPRTYGQERPTAPDAKQESPASVKSQTKEHPFWDGENAWLFAGTGASRTLDYFSTLNMRRRGRQEIFLNNDVVDNHAAFATIEAAATGVSIGAAYLFHRTGHHKLERWTSIVHISAATTGAVRNYCLKTAHAPPTATP
jgi:hypothetical protein